MKLRNALLLLNFGSGSLQNGFPQVELTLYQPGQEGVGDTRSASLPPSPNLAKLLDIWTEGYTFAVKQDAEIAINLSHETFKTRLDLEDDTEASSILRFSRIDWEKTAKTIPNDLNGWLDTPSFRTALEDLYLDLNRQHELDIVLKLYPAQSQKNSAQHEGEKRQKTEYKKAQTTSKAQQDVDALTQLFQLPWHEWRLFQRLPKASLSFCLPDHHAPRLSGKPQDGIRILALFGDKTGVDVDGDLKALEELDQLSKVTVQCEGLKKPLTREKFVELLGDPQGWDILFYGGHSKTRDAPEHSSEDLAGVIFLPEGPVDLNDLKPELGEAIERGLQLALFNSCDGLGMAHLLTQLGLATTLVMGQEVPNGVAVTFAQHFLKQLSNNASCYQALRFARQQLQAIDTQHRCASWLPRMFCNPTISVPQWQQMLQGTQRIQRKRDRRVVLITSLAATISVWGLSVFGVFEGLDQKVYDVMLVNRPQEELDERLLIVTATEEFKDPNKKGRNYLPEATLDELLTKLEQKYEPAVIGLDFRQEESPVLLKWMQEDHILSVCGSIDGEYAVDVAPPKGLDQGQLDNQVGWTLLFPDLNDNINRRWRYLRELDKDTAENEDPSVCNASLAFGTLLAASYIYEQKQSVTITKVDETQSEDETQLEEETDEIKSDYKLESVFLDSLQAGDGGYSGPNRGDWEMMINYRNGFYDGQSGAVAEVITFSQVLEDTLSAEEINDLRGRIILVGGRGDTHQAPYSPTMLGVTLHGHIASQLLSAEYDGRPLMKGVPRCKTLIWVAIVALLAGGSLWGSRNLRLWFALNVLLLCSVLGVSYGLIVMGWWLPVLAPLSGLVITTAVLWGDQILLRSLIGKSV